MSNPRYNHGQSCNRIVWTSTTVQNPTAYRCQQIFDNIWLARYPRPRKIGFNNGGEFKAEFKELCANMGLKEKISLPWNPQSNSILERIYQVLADCLTDFEL